MDEYLWAFLVVCAALSVLSFGGLVTAVCRRGGRHG